MESNFFLILCGSCKLCPLLSPSLPICPLSCKVTPQDKTKQNLKEKRGKKEKKNLLIDTVHNLSKSQIR